MNVDDYQQEAMSLLNPALNPQDVLENALMRAAKRLTCLKSTAFRGIRWIRRS